MDTLNAFAGAIPVVGGIIQSIIGANNVDETNAANLANQQQQEAYNTQMWNMQNAYNSPQAQMQRLQAAGLNPNLVYGSGQATGNVAELPAPAPSVQHVTKPAPDLGSLATSALAAFNSLKSTSAQVNNLQAQTTNTDEDTLLKQALQLNQELEALRNPDVVANIQSQTTKNLADANTTSFLAPFQADLAKANTDKLKADSQFIIDDNTRRAAENTANLKQVAENIRTMAVSRAKSQAEIDQINANTAVLLNSKKMSDLDLQMMNKGMTFHDPIYLRAAQSIANGISGGIHQWWTNLTSPSIAKPGDVIMDTNGKPFTVPKQ